MISKYFVIKACSLNFFNVTVAVSFLSHQSLYLVVKWLSGTEKKLGRYL